MYVSEHSSTALKEEKLAKRGLFRIRSHFAAIPSPDAMPRA
jgi:hypothetical protein